MYILVTTLGKKIHLSSSANVYLDHDLAVDCVKKHSMAETTTLTT